MSFRVGSTFSGIGGFELGFQAAGAETAFLSEIDPGATAVLDHRFPEIPNLGDIAKADPHDLDIDCLVGGFPCQDLSVAGRRAGLAGERSGLFWHFRRLLEATRAPWFVLENVPGLLSSNDGRDMGTVVGALEQLGYGLAWRVLDAQFLGVPQRRRRVFIVGHLGSRGRAGSVLLEREGGCWDPPPRDTDTGDVVRSLALRGREGGSRAELGDDLAFALRASQGGGDKPYVLVEPVAFHQNQRGELTESATMQALNGGGGKPGQGYPAIREGLQVRRLTPRECERLQGFPDDWTLVPVRTLKSGKVKHASDSARYKQVGNAVAVPVTRWIARRLVAADRRWRDG